MKKILTLVSIIFIVIGIAYSQSIETPVPQMDEAVGNLAKDIHAKLIEAGAAKVVIGQYTFADNIPTFSNYWINQLILELTNMSGRNYTIVAGGAVDADWTISGEIIQIADVIRVYSRLTRLSDHAIEGSYISNFQRNEYISDMISSGTGGSSSSGTIDIHEPDSWENPVNYTLGTASANAMLMNRSLTEGDEDFFLLVPDRDGRLTAETTGSIDTYMFLYNYDTEEELAYNDDGGQGTNARITYNVLEGTRYLIIVQGYSSSTNGPYAFRAFLTVREGAGSWNNPVAYEIGLGEQNAAVLNRSMEEGDADHFLLIPDMDGLLIMETTGRLDTYLELFDADTRELLEEDDDGGTNYNARIRYNVNSSSRYIAVVRGYRDGERGTFGFRAYFAESRLMEPDEYEPNDEPSLATPFEIGTSQEHTFHTANDVDWIRFNVTTAGRYTINTRGVNNNRLDTYIELFNSNLNLIAEDDDGGTLLSSRLSLNLSAGTYYLKIWCLDDEPDQPYTLTIE